MGVGGGVVVVSEWHVGCTRGCVSSTADVLVMSVVRGMKGFDGVCETCMCLARDGVRGERVEKIGFWLYQSCKIRGSVGRVSVFGLWLCRRGVDRGLGPWSGWVWWCYVCVSPDYLFRWQVQVYVCCARRIPAHLMSTHCSILLYLIDSCFLPCICLWQI